MRGKPVHGFRLTEKRIARGWLTKKLAEQHRQIESAKKKGRTLSPSLLGAAKQIASNVRVAERHGLLSPKISSLHAVDKSAIRREILLRKTG